MPYASRMKTNNISQQSIVVNEKQAAEFLAVSSAALRRWRAERRGPAFIRLERCIRYRLSDLDAYLDHCAAGAGQAQQETRQ